MFLHRLLLQEKIINTEIVNETKTSDFCCDWEGPGLGAGGVIKQGWKTIVTCFATPFERKTFSQMKIPYEAKDAEHDGVYKEKENGRNKNMHFN